MKIIIQSSQSKIDKYTKLLFIHLQNDKSFEKLIVSSRKNLGLNIPITQAQKDLEVLVKPVRTLRSETIKTLKYEPDIHIETPFVLILDHELDKVLVKYKFLQDWRKGLGSFIVNDRFVISDESSSIKLKVRNKKYLITGKYSDNFSEDGVKIVLTSKVSKKELKDWIGENMAIVNRFLEDLPTLSSKNSRRFNYERDRLIVYLRQKGLFWSQIANELKNIGDKIDDYKTMQDKLQQAYKDFPLI